MLGPGAVFPTQGAVSIPEETITETVSTLPWSGFVMSSGGYPVPPRASRTRTYVRPDWRRLGNTIEVFGVCRVAITGPLVVLLLAALTSLLQSGRTYVLVLEALGGTGYP